MNHKIKQNFFAILLFLVATSIIQAQVIDQKSQELHDMYMQKHKTNKTVGWISLGSGVALIGIGAVVYSNDFTLNESNPNTASGILLGVGAGAALVSIPFFISAGSNKRKANLALKEGTLGIFNEANYKNKYVSLSITVQF